MKKVFLFLMAMMALTANAQEIKDLKVKLILADPMREIKTHLVWYTDRVAISEDQEYEDMWEITIYKADHIFEDGAQRRAKVGLYTSNDSLICLIDGFHGDVSDDRRRLGINYGYTESNQKVNVKKIVDHLLNTDGYIRVTAPMYGGYWFDERMRYRKNKE